MAGESLCPSLHIAAALILDNKGRCLLVRKRGTTAFMQPGGKIDAGETAEEALVRELMEELSITVMPDQVTFLGQFSAEAVNEPGYQLNADLFRVIGVDGVKPAAEIEEIAWVDPHSPGTRQIAPLSKDHILPLAATL